MPGELYELIALGMRYWFVLLGLIIVWRALRWALKDYRRHQRTLSALPYAGLIGEIVNLDTGQAQDLPREGILGSGKACDIRLKELRSRELEYLLREGQGVALYPWHRQHHILLNGEPLKGGELALHGARLSLAGYQLRIRLFADLDIPQSAVEEQPAASMQTAPEDFNMADLADFPMAGEEQLWAPPEGEISQAPQPADPRQLEITWLHALPPVEAYDQPPMAEPEQDTPENPVRRRRRSGRHGR